MTQVIASDATKRTGPFRCPNCKAPLSLRKGTHNLAHFAHKRPITCDYGKGETLAHRRCKLEIYSRLRMHPAAREVKLEHHLGAVRPDVFAYILGKPVAIEVQLSTLSPERIATRTTEYTKRGISVLWLMQWTPKLDGHRYSPKRFERWLHAAYYGRVYYWQEGLTIIPYSFESHLIHVDEYNWKTASGQWRTGGGYKRHSKRFRRAVAGQRLHMIADFRPVTRLPWRSRNLSVPKSHLYMDRYSKPTSDPRL